MGPITTIKTAEWVDLTHTFDPDIPRFSEFEKAKYPHYLQSKNMAFMYNVGISLHNTAHIDAPIHFVENKRYLEDLDLKELVLPLIVLDYSKEVKIMMTLS